MKRVLIITYYWPPSGGSGVQRWLKMSKYMPEYGWQPVIYTPENAEYPVEDHSLERDITPEAEIIRRPIFEPYTFYKRLIGAKKSQKVKIGFVNEEGRKGGWKQDLSLWIRGNLFIPDARCHWVRPSVRFLKEYLKAHPVDALISTGPPHSMHLIAMELHNELGIPWVADFRDPWTEIDYYNEFHLTKRSDRKHHKMEHEVLSTADEVVTVADDGARRLERIGGRCVKTIYNGFDNEDASQASCSQLPDKFTITYIGNLTKPQNPENLWAAIRELTEENELFKSRLAIRLIGQIDNSAVHSIRQNHLDDYVETRPYIPHDEAIKAQRSATLLLLLLMHDDVPRSKGLLTGKLFEYLYSGRPILCIGPEDGDAANIISECTAGHTASFSAKARMKELITEFFMQHENGALKGCDRESIEKYSRKSLTKDYTEILNSLIRHEK